MKKISLFLLFAMCVMTANAQRYMRVTKLDGSTTTFAVNEIDSIDFIDPFNGHEYVDLGLPSGILWAKMNIGASSPEEDGLYFAWGETTNRCCDFYNIEKYQWYTYEVIVETDAEGFETTTYESEYTKYCTDAKYGPVDNLTTLELVDDAAHVNWGGFWRMPTKAEFEELIEYCNWEWKTLRGVNGYKVSSKAEGNSNYIFLPAACYDHYRGSYGYYWSSSLIEDNPSRAWDLDFSYGHLFDTSKLSDSRNEGKSIRPVCFPIKK